MFVQRIWNLKINNNFFFILLQKRRERGRISVKGIRLVEFAIINGEGADSSSPEVCYYFQNFLFVQLVLIFFNFCSRVIHFK